MHIRILLERIISGRIDHWAASAENNPAAQENGVEHPVINTVEDAWTLRNSDRAAARAASESLLNSADADLRATTLAQVVLCFLDYREQRYEQAAAAGLAALPILEARPDDPWLPRLYNTLAIIHLDLGERDTCRAYLDQQIRLSHELGDRTYEALGYHDLGLLQAAVDPGRGLATLAEARAMFHGNDDAENEALTLYNMSNIYQHAGSHERAASCIGQALQMVRASGTRGMALYITLHILTLMAAIASARGQRSEAQTLLDEARAWAVRHFPEALPHVQFCQGSHLAAVGDDTNALTQFQDCLARLGPSGKYDLLADCHAALADCNERLGDYRAALAHHRAYAAIRERTFIEASEQKVRALDVIHQITTARQAAEAERQRNAALQHYIQELEQLQSSLRAMSLRDPLTDLHNRRYLNEEGERLLRHAQRYGDHCCAAMIDVDHFKHINDRLGHALGDRVLQHLATIVTDAMRSTDLIARYGGEELALLLPSTSLGNAYAICERLRTTVEQHTWRDIHPTLQVTISIGLADHNGDNLAELLARADAQLYAAKHAGRNRTSYAHDLRQGMPQM